MLFDPSNPGVEAVGIVPVGMAKIPPRRWAYGKFLLFGSAAVIGAVDGVGKGFIVVGMILSMITGEPLLGEKVWRKGPVGIVSYEDDMDEWHRRIAAACEKYQLDYEHILENIRFISRPDNGRIVFAMNGAVRGETLFPDGQSIIATLKAIGAVLLVIDPFNHAHGFDDGNNNVVVAKVAVEISRIAKESGAAVLLIHHLRKGPTGSADDLMGAVSLRATFRSCRILMRMMQDVAEKMNLTDHWRYIRIAGSKENYAAPPDKSTWFKLESVNLGNGTDEYPDGDDMAVAVRWQPPSAFQGLDLATMARIFAKLREGTGVDGWFYSRSPRANWPAGAVITQIAGKTPDEASAILDLWLQNGVFTEEPYKTPTKNDAKRIVLNEAKIAEILAPLAYRDDSQ